MPQQKSPTSCLTTALSRGLKSRVSRFVPREMALRPVAPPCSAFVMRRLLLNRNFLRNGFARSYLFPHRNAMTAPDDWDRPRRSTASCSVRSHYFHRLRYHSHCLRNCSRRSLNQSHSRLAPSTETYHLRSTCPQSRYLRFRNRRRLGRNSNRSRPSFSCRTQNVQNSKSARNLLIRNRCRRVPFHLAGLGTNRSRNYTSYRRNDPKKSHNCRRMWCHSYHHRNLHSSCRRPMCTATLGGSPSWPAWTLDSIESHRTFPRRYCRSKDHYHKLAQRMGF